MAFLINVIFLAAHGIRAQLLELRGVVVLHHILNFRHTNM